MAKTYSDKLKDPRWQKKRLKILERDDWMCCKCGEDTKPLHVHHTAYKGNPWEADDNQLQTLCEDCHWLIEDFKKTGLDVIAIKRSSEFFLISYVLEGEKVMTVYWKNKLGGIEAAMQFCFTQSSIEKWIDFLKQPR